MSDKNKNGKKQKNKRAGRAGSASRSRASKKAAALSRGGKTGAPSELMTGVLEGAPKGYAFMRNFDGRGDVFIPHNALHGALSGDTVSVRAHKSQKGLEGEVKEVLTRRNPEFNATVRGGLLYPDERGLSDTGISWRSGEVNGKSPQEGDRVRAALVDYKTPLYADVIEIYGRSGDPAAEIMAIIRAKNLRERFPKNVLKEAANLPSDVSETEAAGRKDYRNQAAVTIDGADSKDFDDAVHVEKTKAGGYVLSVHIADVAHYVRPNTALDKEAFTRGTSVYFADRVLPMLPEALSTGICSLNEGEDRLTLSVEIDYDDAGTVTGHRIFEGIIRSKKRLTYDAVQQLFDGGEIGKLPAAVLKSLSAAKELAGLLLRGSVTRGAVDFDVPECVIDVDKAGNVKDVRRKDRLLSHRLIEMFMIAANEVVAQHFNELKVPFVYRVHEKPPVEKAAAFSAYLEGLAIEFTDEPTQNDYNELLKRLEGDDIKGAVTRCALRSMSKADYRPKCEGHFGLALEYYAHFTSPIRRYPDLMIHRVIKQVLSDGAKSANIYAAAVRDAATQSSLTERAAEDAERKVDDLLKAMFMRDKIGETFEGVISGVQDFGLFIELDNGIEGLLKTEDLPGNGYVFDDKRLNLKNAARSFGLGDKLVVAVSAVNHDKISFIPAFPA